jgi:hypothetical protein
MGLFRWRNNALPEAVRVLMLVAKAFEDLHIPYLVGGSMASALYGVARSTLDADIVADIRPEQVRKLVAALGSDFYADDAMIRSIWWLGAGLQHSFKTILPHSQLRRRKNSSMVAANRMHIPQKVG